MQKNETKTGGADSHLRTRPQDIRLHTARRIFAIVEGEVRVAPAETALSHLEWFEMEGWCSTADRASFMERTCRGMYLPTEDSLYAYQGNGFFIHSDTRKTLLAALEQLSQALSINRGTEIHLGPKDEVVHGVRYERVYLGRLDTLLS